MKEHLVTLDSAEQAWLLATGAGIIERHARLIRERFEQIAQEGRHWPAPWNVPYLLADLEGIEYNLRQLKRELPRAGYGG
jgi:hypothetical protein